MAKEMLAPWMIPIITLSVNVVLSPIVLSFLAKRRERREDKTSEATIHLEFIKVLQGQLAAEIAENDRADARYKSLRAAHDNMVDAKYLDHLENITKIESLELKIASARARRAEAGRRVDNLIELFDFIAKTVEDSDCVACETTTERGRFILKELRARVESYGRDVGFLSDFLKHMGEEAGYVVYRKG